MLAWLELVGNTVRVRVATLLSMPGTGLPCGESDALTGVLSSELSEATSGSGVCAADMPTAADTTDREKCLADLCGAKGQANGGVYQFNVPRRDAVTEGGMTIPTPMGSAHVINFQPTGGGKAAITGDFVLTANEVMPMVRTLRSNGIDVTAMHSHMLTEQPRLIFMHYWAVDDAVKLARSLRAGLDKTASVKN